MDLSVELLGLKFENPLGPSAGPLTEGLENMRFFNSNKCGVNVSKTISVLGADVPKPCIAGTTNTIYNCELWSELHSDVWINEILPTIHAEKKKPLIISAGYHEEDFRNLIPKLDPFADIFEISTHYVKENLAGIVRSIRENTDKPVFMKLSPHVIDFLEFTKIVLDAGATGIVAINSLGPGTAIDLKKRSVLLAENIWMSGPSIKPIALHRIYNIRKAYPDIPIIGVGGIGKAEDVLEFMLAGADLVQMLSSALIKGRQLYDKIIKDLPAVLEKYGFSSIEEIRDIRKETVFKDVDTFVDNFPSFNDKCNMCGLCVRICPAGALSAEETIVVDKEKCIHCGLCESRCPQDAIFGVLR
ncbi:MAG: 4Fe-4S binding protein [Candidatus Heimdallarchaeota archaeon]|nr:4Fe-4S binding protein [Candidatus Heimdallarchaeota archaeon]